jgi:hypothetical protein
MRRPSPALLISVLALFVALGGPAQAAKLINGKTIKKGTITSTQVKDGSLGEKELTKGARKALRAVANGSVTAASIVTGAVTAAQIAPGAVDGVRLAPNAVDGSKVADNSLNAADIATGGIGSGEVANGAIGATEIRDNSIDAGEIVDGGLGAKDVGRFAGALVDLPYVEIANGQCDTSTSTSLTPLRANESLIDDVIVVTPEVALPDKVLVSAAAASANQIVVTLCNFTGGPLAAGARDFSYVSIDRG